MYPICGIFSGREPLFWKIIGTSDARESIGSPIMRAACLVGSLFFPLAAFGAELESRVLTHYVPQDFLEAVVRREGWTELPLNLKGGVRKGDVVRIWAGGLIDRGNGDQPGENVAG